MTVVPRLGIEPGTPGFEIPDANHSTTADSFETYKQADLGKCMLQQCYSTQLQVLGICVFLYFKLTRTAYFVFLYCKRLYLCSFIYNVHFTTSFLSQSITS